MKTSLLISVIIILVSLCKLELRAQGNVSKRDTCFHIFTVEPPKFLKNALIDKVAADKYPIDFIKLFSPGDYNGISRYVRIFRKNNQWYFESDQSPAKQIVIYVDEILNENSVINGSHLVYVCSGAARRSSEFYLIYINGKIADSISSNVELNNMVGDENIKKKVKLMTELMRRIQE